MDEVSSVERFDRIDGRLHQLEIGQKELKADVAGLKVDIVDLKSDVASLKGDVAGLKTDVSGIKGEVAGVKADVASLKGEVTSLGTELNAKITDLGQQMRILHEDTIEKIAALAGHPFATQADVSKVNSRVDNLIGQRVVPLEAAVRTLSRSRKPKNG